MLTSIVDAVIIILGSGGVCSNSVPDMLLGREGGGGGLNAPATCIDIMLE